MDVMKLGENPSDRIGGFFYRDGKPLDQGPKWGMSLKKAGSMRFRWNETNPNRLDFLSGIAGRNREIAQVELIHSKTVYPVDDAEEVLNLQGDGIITKNPQIIPVVTCADCMPIFIYNPETKVFGTLHSGWKGTGIVAEAIQKACRIYGGKPSDFCVVLGPHIHSCCYKIDEERAKYFSVNFGEDCVEPYNNRRAIHFPGDPKKGQLGDVVCDSVRGDWTFSLSLAQANVNVLHGLGIDDGSIVVARECTCCNHAFGSFRRQTLGLPPDMPMEERQRHFTVQACWTKWD